MGIIDKMQQEKLEYIRLEHFLYVLNSSIDGTGFGGFYLLPELLDKGLPLRYTESGYVFDEQMAFKGDIKCALIRLENKLFDTDEPESKLYKDAIVETQDGLEISLGNLLVKRSDVEKIYSEYGEAKYPWALVLWPQSSDEWDWFPINARVTANSQPKSKKVNDTPNNKRTTMLNGWLREKWDEWGKLNAKDFAAKLKPYVNTLGSPVKKYHGWYPDVVVEWLPGWGSQSQSWGRRAFQNKVSDFKRDDKKTEKNNCQ